MTAAPPPYPSFTSEDLTAGIELLERARRINFARGQGTFQDYMVYTCKVPHAELGRLTDLDNRLRGCLTNCLPVETWVAAHEVEGMVAYLGACSKRKIFE